MTLLRLGRPRQLRRLPRQRHTDLDPRLPAQRQRPRRLRHRAVRAPARPGVKWHMVPEPKRLGWFARCAAGVLLVVWARTARAPPAEGYAITIDGAPTEMDIVPIEDSVDDPSPWRWTTTAPVWGRGVWSSGPPSRYSFAFENDWYPDAWLPDQTGRETPPGWVRVTQSEDHGRTVVETRLRELSRGATQGPAGSPPRGLVEGGRGGGRLRDLAHVCISIGRAPARRRSFRAGLRYLALSLIYHQDLPASPVPGALVFLRVVTNDDPFDCGLDRKRLTNTDVSADGRQRARKCRAIEGAASPSAGWRLHAPKDREVGVSSSAMPFLRELTVRGPST